jgi:hypothetical protein
MGFFDVFFRKGDGRVMLAFSELDGWLERETAKTKNRTLADSKPAVAGILEARDRLRERVLALMELPSEDAPPRLRSIVKTSKPEYTSTMLDILNQITLEEEADYPTVMEFQKKLQEYLEKIAKATLSQGRYLPFAHGDAFTAIQKDITGLIDAGKKLSSALETSGVIQRLDSIKTLNGELKKSVEITKNMKDDLKAVKNDLQEQNDRLSDAKKEHSKLLEDDRTTELRKELEENAKKTEAVKSRIHESLTSINRPLRKYQRIALSEKRIPEEALRSLDGFIERPVGEFLSGKDPSAILLDLEKALVEGKLDVKNPEKLKKAVRDCLENLKPSLISEHNSLLTARDRIQNELNNSYAAEKTRALESLLAQIKAGITEKEGQTKALEKKQMELESQIAEARNTLKARLGEFNITLSESTAD